MDQQHSDPQRSSTLKQEPFNTLEISTRQEDISTSFLLQPMEVKKLLLWVEMMAHFISTLLKNLTRPPGPGTPDLQSLPRKETSLAPLHFPEAWFAKRKVAWNYEKTFLSILNFHIMGFSEPTFILTDFENTQNCTNMFFCLRNLGKCNEWT